MEKHIIKWSYWLGILSVVLAVLCRITNVMMGPDVLRFPGKGNPVGYHTFLAGAVLLFLTAIASASYSSFNSQGRRP